MRKTTHKTPLTQVVLVFLNAQFDHPLGLLEDHHGFFHPTVIQPNIINGQQTISWLQGSYSITKDHFTSISVKEGLSHELVQCVALMVYLCAILPLCISEMIKGFPGFLLAANQNLSVVNYFLICIIATQLNAITTKLDIIYSLLNTGCIQLNKLDHIYSYIFDL